MTATIYAALHQKHRSAPRIFTKIDRRIGDGLGRVRWVCGECGGTHDRDVNAAKNIRLAARCSPSVSGNEFSPSAAPPSQAPRLREARISVVKAAV